MQELLNTVLIVIEFVGVGTIIAVLRDAKKARKERKAEAEKQAAEIELIKEGNRCQLRSNLLSIYYHCREFKTIRQYERENFDKLYRAYKALGGNSFIDDIYKEIRSYSVIT